MNSKTTLTGLWTLSIITITNYNLFLFPSSTPSPILLDYCLLVEPLFKFQLFCLHPYPQFLSISLRKGKNQKITFTESATPPPSNTHLYPYLPPSFLSLQRDTLSKLKSWSLPSCTGSQPHWLLQDIAQHSFTALLSLVVLPLLDYYYQHTDIPKSLHCTSSSRVHAVFLLPYLRTLF